MSPTHRQSLDLRKKSIDLMCICESSLRLLLEGEVETEEALPTPLYFIAQLWPSLPQRIFHQPLAVSVGSISASVVFSSGWHVQNNLQPEWPGHSVDLKIHKLHTAGTITWVLNLIADVSHPHHPLMITTNICEALLRARADAGSNIISFNSHKSL